jgi:hypothetical protein
MQWPLTSQLHGSVSQREQLVFSLWIKLHALIQQGVPRPALTPVHGMDPKGIVYVIEVRKF